MDFLKKIFPMSFRATEKDHFTKALIFYIVILVIGIIVGAVLGALLGGIPVIGSLVGLILKLFGTVVDVFGAGGIVLSILVFTKVIKD